MIGGRIGGRLRDGLYILILFTVGKFSHSYLGAQSSLKLAGGDLTPARRYPVRRAGLWGDSPCPRCSLVGTWPFSGRFLVGRGVGLGVKRVVSVWFAKGLGHIHGQSWGLRPRKQAEVL